jgi:arylsulfatase A-like enzyme
VLGNRAAFRDAHPEWISLPQLFRQHGYATVRAGKIFHGGIDDPQAWQQTSGGEAAEEGGQQPVHSGRIVVQGHPLDEVGHTAPPADSVGRRRAQYSDRIVMLEGNGEGHGDYHAVDRTIENLRQFKNRPFFIACGLVKPHSPPTAPKRFFELYDEGALELPPDFAPWPTVPPGFPAAAIRKKNADLFIGRPASPAEARQMIRAYLASVSWADWNFGRIINELDRLGLRENTIIVVVADHGYQLGEKGKWSKAGSLFEMGARVPLLIHDPRAAGNGRSCAQIVESLDLYPTLVELCGLAAPAGLEGRSLVPLLHRPEAAWDHPGYTVWSEDGQTYHGVAVRTERWRYAEFGPQGTHGAMLFDEVNDPQELHNLVADPSCVQVVAELSRLTRSYAA